LSEKGKPKQAFPAIAPDKCLAFPGVRVNAKVNHFNLSQLHTSETGAVTMRCLRSTLIAMLMLLMMQRALPQDASLNAKRAKAAFAEAHALCSADQGHLWGVSLCGPMMLADPSNREAITSEEDALGVLRNEKGLFVGKLPGDVPISNTSMTWSGTHWIQYRWPLPDDAALRRVMLMHESFHRIQDQLNLHADNANNPQLDTFEGRYDLQMEWRALAAALKASDDGERRKHVADALAFRALRYQHFASAEASEAYLEHNEGLAEYTAIVIAMPTAEQRVAMALRDIQTIQQTQSFVRSFAYATGPAYGLLLDAYRPGWRNEMQRGAHLADLLADALGLSLHAVPDSAALETLAARYNGMTLRQTELARQHTHDTLVQGYRDRLIAGHVLVLPLKKPSIQFDPRNLIPIDGYGTIYPTLRATDEWGHIDVQTGSLMTDDWKQLTVTAPSASKGNQVQGAGWTLELAPGWRLRPGPRHGDEVVSKDGSDRR
jgi:hypothetical protein